MQEPARVPASRRKKWSILLLMILLAAVIPPLAVWQRTGQQRAASLSNMRRIAMGMLAYSQDWDGRPMPDVRRLPDGTHQTWPQLIAAYLDSPDDLSNPANPVSADRPLRDPTRGFPVTSSYAVNERLWNTFAPGPFPVDSIELPYQTVMLVEAGTMSREMRSAGDSRFGLLTYHDMSDRVFGLVPYPSTHNSRLAVVAMDAHASTVRVEHYRQTSGPHDPLYGRIGAAVYNWNGGHPNGETDQPARE